MSEYELGRIIATGATFIYVLWFVYWIGEKILDKEK